MSVDNDEASTQEAALEQPVRGDIFVSIALVCVGLGVLYVGRSYGKDAFIWPSTLAVLLITLVFVDITIKAIKRRSRLKQSDSTEQTEAVRRQRLTLIQVATIAFVPAYLIVGYGFGYFISTMLLVPTYMLTVSAEKRPVLIVSTTVVLAGFMQWLFGSVLNVPVSYGAWGGLDLTWLPF